MLFLALVDHGDAVEEDGEGEDVFGELWFLLVSASRLILIRAFLLQDHRFYWRTGQDRGSRKRMLGLSHRDTYASCS